MFIVMAYNSSGVVTAVGTKAGFPFKTEESAEKMETKVQRLHPTIRTMVIEIEGGPE